MLSNAWNEPATNSSAHQLVPSQAFSPLACIVGLFFRGLAAEELWCNSPFFPLSLSPPFQNGVLFFLPACSARCLAASVQSRACPSVRRVLRAGGRTTFGACRRRCHRSRCFSSFSPPMFFPSFLLFWSWPRELHELRFQHAQHRHRRLADMPC